MPMHPYCNIMYVYMCTYTHCVLMCIYMCQQCVYLYVPIANAYMCFAALCYPVELAPRAGLIQKAPRFVTATMHMVW